MAALAMKGAHPDAVEAKQQQETTSVSVASLGCSDRVGAAHDLIESIAASEGLTAWGPYYTPFSRAYAWAGDCEH